MQSRKGWICLDIDGTITCDAHTMPEEVSHFFASLYKSGWQFVFITGRTFSFANAVLQSLPFPYYFAVQNGADIFLMPEKKLLAQHYISSSVMKHLDELYQGKLEDYIVYSGWQKGDFCYFRPQRFSSSMMDHLKVLMTLVQEPWQQLTSFAPLAGQSFPLIKCMGSREHMMEIEQYLKSYSSVSSSAIKDPLSLSGSYINLVTAKEATKGSVVRYLKGLSLPSQVFIAAGDDRNDISLLHEADISIAMSGAPEDLLSLADIIAPSASQLGIIYGLKEAMKNL